MTDPIAIRGTFHQYGVLGNPSGQWQIIRDRRDKDDCTDIHSYLADEREYIRHALSYFVDAIDPTALKDTYIYDGTDRKTHPRKEYPLRLIKSLAALMRRYISDDPYVYKRTAGEIEIPEEWWRSFYRSMTPDSHATPHTARFEVTYNTDKGKIRFLALTVASLEKEQEASIPMLLIWRDTGTKYHILINANIKPAIDLDGSMRKVISLANKPNAIYGRPLLTVLHH